MNDETITIDRREFRRQMRQIRHQNDGVVAGVFACVFGLLGMFSIGLIFVPLAAFCTMIGLVRGLTGPSVGGIGVSLLGAVVTALAIVVSPTVWVAIAAMFAP